MKRLALILIALFAARLAHAQTATVAPAPGIYTATNPSSGAACAGCELFTYFAGTTIKALSYQNANETATNTNPVILNSAGQAQIWLDTNTTYKFVLAPAGSSDPPTNPFWTTDNISSAAGGGGGSGTVFTTGSPNAGNLAAFSGAFSITGSNLSGDCTTTNTLTTTCLKTGGVSFGSLATLSTVNNSNWSGTALAVGNGGTGQTTYTNGQLLIGNTSTTGLSKATLTAGANVTITNGAGTITIASSGGTGSGCIPTGAANDILFDTGSGTCGSSAGAISSGGRIVLPASGTGGAFLNLGQGVAPTSPVNGDCWTTTADLFCFLNSATQQYLTTASAASTYAPLASPALTGVPTAPTAANGTNTTQLATTAFVIANAGSGVPCTVTAGAMQYNNGGAFGCAPATASSSNISMASGATLTPSTTKGIVGTTAADNAQAGSDGEFISSSIAVGSAVSLTSGTAANVTSISLTAGDWDCWANVAFHPGASAAITEEASAISTTSATFPTQPNGGAYQNFNGTVTVTATDATWPTGITRKNVSSTTTVYLVAYSTFSADTNSAYGFLGCRRVR